MTTNQIRKNPDIERDKDSSHDPLLEAQKNAINARETAMEAVGRISEERNAMNTLDDTLAKILDEAERRIRKHGSQKQVTVPEPDDGSFPDEPIDIYPEIKRKTANPEMSGSRQIIQLIHDLTEEKAQAKTQQLNEEARIHKIQAQQALDEAETVKKAAENAIGLAQEEASRYREEAEKASDDARLAISLARERVKAASEEIKAVQQQASVDTNRATAEVLKAKEEAEIARRESRKAISRAEAESQKAREEAEIAKRTAAEIIHKAREESRKITEEAETSITRVNASLLEAQQHVTNMTREDINTARPETGCKPYVTAGNQYQDLLDNLTEMHNPLHSISGFARMILDDNICDAVAEKEFVRTILQQSENLKLQLDNIHRVLKVNLR